MPSLLSRDFYLPNVKFPHILKQIRPFCCSMSPSYPQKYFSNIYILKSLRAFRCVDRERAISDWKMFVLQREWDVDGEISDWRGTFFGSWNYFCVYMHNTLMLMFMWFPRSFFCHKSSSFSRATKYLLLLLRKINKAHMWTWRCDRNS